MNQTVWYWIILEVDVYFDMPGLWVKILQILTPVWHHLNLNAKTNQNFLCCLGLDTCKLRLEGLRYSTLVNLALKQLSSAVALKTSRGRTGVTYAASPSACPPFQPAHACAHVSLRSTSLPCDAHTERERNVISPEGQTISGCCKEAWHTSQLRGESKADRGRQTHAHQRGAAR